MNARRLDLLDLLVILRSFADGYTAVGAKAHAQALGYGPWALGGVGCWLGGGACEAA